MKLKRFAVLGAVTATAVAATPKVKIGRTTVVGRENATAGVDFFGGIPFAEPPVGSLRFRSPILKTRYTETTLSRQAAMERRVFNRCVHDRSVVVTASLNRKKLKPLVIPLADTSEDCLSINVVGPTGTRIGDKLPVLRRVGTPVIYVNFNYRLGPFGFPQGQEGDCDSRLLFHSVAHRRGLVAHDRRELNLGMKDVTAALEWVHANINFFGGDKNKITIFGESAGAITIGILYLNRQFEKLVRGAALTPPLCEIFQSGSSNSLPLCTAAERESEWQAFVRAIPSCANLATSGNTFACLQNATREEIAGNYLNSLGPNFMVDMVFSPTRDRGPGSLLPEIPSRLYSQGKFARIPYIAGTNLDEGTLFATSDGNADLEAGIVASVSPPLVDSTQFEQAIDGLMEQYPDVPALGSPYNTGDELFGFPSVYKRHSAIPGIELEVLAEGDMLFDAPRRQWMQATAQRGVKSYGYLFTHPHPGPLGVLHAAEIPFVYGPPPDPLAAAQSLSVAMVDYWISFTDSLDPNDGKGVQRPVWPSYTNRNQRLAYLISNALAFRR
ncbi:lipase I [Coprinopsis cinerea okayama7|uniref:Carboxylic ester hydrolase n=1 Tax=Coprinopsis cinerea (strain Okayama-7 / 130 / ATCC MYA-4618 / FGSC 9003) TaxID=240176 RepID=A8NCU6_COPC7|nr:lipase I [Coprinopsis cinerea okayama7\|eukprot:XP_001832630.2 lipase I [Coprinopsis cinerea okayama7\